MDLTEIKTGTGICATCAYLITDEGEPFYCAAQDLYTFVEPTDKACSEYTIAIKKTIIMGEEIKGLFRKAYNKLFRKKKTSGIIQGKGWILGGYGLFQHNIRVKK